MGTDHKIMKDVILFTRTAKLQVYFERVDGVLTLDPHDVCVQ